MKVFFKIICFWLLTASVYSQVECNPILEEDFTGTPGVLENFGWQVFKDNGEIRVATVVSVNNEVRASAKYLKLNSSDPIPEKEVIFGKNITGFKEGENYIVEFVQDNLTNFNDQGLPDSAYWKVSLGGQVKNSPYKLVTSNESLFSYEKVRLKFIANSTSMQLTFSPIRVGIEDGFSSSRFYNIITMSMAQLIIYQEGDCQDIPENNENHSSFQPIPNKEYVLSAWVSTDQADVASAGAAGLGAITISMGGVVKSFTPKGPVIDGWQQIQEAFTIPQDASNLNLSLKSIDPNVKVYFDDIRIHPFNANMKSFVYDPVTQRLMAELDENNYATFYEYDQEGGLIRVKKETEKGIYTIQETRSGTSKLVPNNTLLSDQ